jgi:hypothetical protein
MFRRLSLIVAAMTVFMLVLSPAAFGKSKVATYEVTITNLTDGQPLTPPVAYTHKKKVSLFEAGEAASPELMALAENGNSGPLFTALDGDKHVYDSLEAGEPLVPATNPGMTPFSDTVTLTITATGGAKYLTVASMLICTNDGFTGVNGLRLPKKMGDSTTVMSAAYDAGTEINTEDFANLVPPCQGLIGVSSADTGTGMSDPTLAEGGVVAHHSGIDGVGVLMSSDLVPGVHGWTNPVVSITVERVG